MIRLGRLRVKNFKSFLAPTEFDFRGNDVAIFDGPNGFGKTTIFDAIELCVTGKIGRVYKTDNKQKSSHFLKNNIELETEILLELIENGCTKAVIFLIIPTDLTKNDNKISAFNVQKQLLSTWPKYYESDQYEHMDGELESILGNKQLKSTFSLFNYVQQEETCHFLKQTEIDRHKQISHLFGTTNEIAERDNLKSIQVALNLRINDVQKSIEQTQQDIDKIEQRYSEAFDRFKEVEVVKPSGSINKLAKIETSIDSEINFELTSRHLSSLQWLSNNLESYAQLRLNTQVEVLCNQRDQALNDLILVGRAKDFSKIKKISKHLRWVNRISAKVIEYEKIISEYEKASSTVNLQLLQLLELQFERETENHKSKISDFRTRTNEVGSYDRIMKAIISSRDSLKSHYQEHLSKIGASDGVDCPLCGDHKQSENALWEDFEQQEQEIVNLQSSASKQLTELEGDLTKNFVQPLILKSNNFLKKYKKYLSLKQGLQARDLSEDRWSQMIKVKHWLEQNNINFKAFTMGSLLEKQPTLGSLVFELKQLIKDLSKPVDTDFSFSHLKESLSFFSINLETNLLKNESGDLVSSESIEHDIDYVNYLEAKSKSKKLEANNKSIRKQTTLMTELKRKSEEVGGLINTYNREIKKFESSVAKQIAIPFYIFSSKILQTRPDGNGIFLQTAENAKEAGYIRFVSNLKDDHDAWNTMSSGQLSGLVISFMLAMNKIYPTELGALLIDDPVQTMDEINMTSFVQLLKNEFPNTQIILSTHEKKVANYLIYKYKQSGADLQRISLKQLRLTS
ncbi:ATP-binding protein [Pseudoalteromonas spongiae]|uniref:ATP-binding protein n=1 Tax=Pseudoalteromonas spongiae TaxID=298657 RepID=UPI00110BE02D|nr:ATP-binding protein [Pseudoalteromonas spongiae]TMO81730.1 hypothetical protein CWC15_20585 [Pseudoalteromonas spongiae]